MYGSVLLWFERNNLHTDVENPYIIWERFYLAKNMQIFFMYHFLCIIFFMCACVCVYACM